MMYARLRPANSRKAVVVSEAGCRIKIATEVGFTWGLDGHMELRGWGASAWAGVESFVSDVEGGLRDIWLGRVRTRSREIMSIAPQFSRIFTVGGLVLIVVSRAMSATVI